MSNANFSIGLILRFVGLLTLQTLILCRIELPSGITPVIYPLCILMLPFEVQRWLSLILAFLTGLIIDVFVNTPGLHASATVFMAYLRHPVIAFNRPVSDYQPGDKPSIASLGLKWFAIYCLILLLAHQTFYYVVDAYSFSYFDNILPKIALSTGMAFVLCVLFEYIFHPPPRRNS
ncbi:MAG: rod shape-determining protein MreD [Sphingobacteriales bacterium]|jgi:rod shape-determining protein MreD|nr:rod shape-determining protein MreD [Sphingobacteriales bacterium]MBP9141857.1 hypothetical protein [Chitinophagales bacterium]MDA0199859.1 rod shape-determining protein MreD [Bacteroidota bacterium]MBK6889481.1 rod shape-determining protein MreD [Sphingobacteriales bacterium]MBK7528015.1 rod shape-determining protein MreD [Sphingobacteriales bacterium]